MLDKMKKGIIGHQKASKMNDLRLVVLVTGIVSLSNKCKKSSVINEYNKKPTIGLFIAYEYLVL
ncbi:hypothetical protein ID741_003711 [Enterococcus sp. AZ103]